MSQVEKYLLQEWMRRHDEVKAQRDQLAKALRDITEEAEEFARALPPYQNSEALAKARAALKQLEEE